MKPFKRVPYIDPRRATREMRPDGYYTRKEFNRATGEIERGRKFTADYPLQVTGDVAGHHLRLADQPFFARITGIDVASSCGNTGYTFIEIEHLAGGCTQDVDGGRSGTCYHANGWTGVTEDMIVRLYRVGDDWRFKGCCDSGGGDGGGVCGYTITATLDWTGDADLDLYGQNITEAGAVVFYSHHSDSGLTLNNDANPTCIVGGTVPETITGSFEGSREFRFWYNQYSSCQVETPPTVSVVTVSNTGTRTLNVNGSPLAEGDSVSFALEYGGYATHDISRSFLGGTSVVVSCGSCSYSLSAFLNWSDPVGCFLSQVIYGANDTTGDPTCYYLRTSSGGLTSGGVRNGGCANDGSDPTASRITGDFTEGQSFRFWYNEPVQCCLNPGIACCGSGVTVTNTGDDAILVNGTVVEPADSILVTSGAFGLEDAGHNNGDQEAYVGGTAVVVQCATDDCGGCSDLTVAWQATIAGFTNNTIQAHCGACAETSPGFGSCGCGSWNGTWTLTQGVACNYAVTLPAVDSRCSGPCINATATLSLVYAAGAWTASIAAGCSSDTGYTLVGTFDCTGPNTFTKSSDPYPFFPCANAPASITFTPL